MWLFLLLACQPSPTLPPPAASAADSLSLGQAEAMGLAPIIDPSSVGLDAAALDVLLWRAWESHSDALLIAKDGQVVVRWTSDPSGEPVPIETMSMAKSFVSLGVGMLLDEGAIPSLDEPVARWYPQWADEREDITLRHMLEHSSGLAAPPSREIYASQDFVEFALDSELTGEPGARWVYNNNGSNLVAGIASSAAGRPLDDYITERLFAPLGIEDSVWQRDAAGNTHGLAGLALCVDDLHIIGELLLADGVWEGQQLVSSGWLADSTTPTALSQDQFGLQWWSLSIQGPCLIDDTVLSAWREAGVDEDFVEAIAPLKDRDLGEGFLAAVKQALGGTESGMERWHANTWQRGLPDCRRQRTQVGYRADGWLGQHLIVMPEHGIVAVRQRIALPGHEQHGSEHTDGLKDLPALVLGLVD
jgi:CubicO group peptidase (beta-lactamase class C family)